MLRRLVDDHRFALTDLVLVMLSGAIWMMKPEFGVWVILIALLPWVLRSLAGRFPFRRTPFDWLIAVFLVTAWVGYWVAYDKASAWNKVWFIVLAVLLFYALSAQPRQNLAWGSAVFFPVGLGVSIYFFLTHDFSGTAGRLAIWWMNSRPQVEWRAIHHGYISGTILITTLIARYGVWKLGTYLPRRSLFYLSPLFVLSSMILMGAFALTLSRGIWLAIAGAAGAWVVWKVLTLSKFSATPVFKTLFPLFVLNLLAVIMVLVYLGPGGPDYNPTQGDYGTNTRSELFLRGTYLLADFPILGGGLSSFPGLYSQYMLGIPIFYFANSYNIFLDVAIEQGLIGGLSFLLLYLASLWLLAKTIVTTNSGEIRTFSWFALSALMVSIVHGLLYDYLYNGAGAFLLLFPVGVAMIGIMNPSSGAQGLSPTAVHSHAGRSVRPALIVSGALIILLAGSFNHVRALWYANLGALQMTQVELKDFPTNTWTESSILPELGSAEASLHSALRLEPANRTANHRLGLIAMLRGDFDSACGYLESALEQTPRHRGILKSLGYCYVWLGDMDRAQVLLAEIPESRDEMDIYTWWWGVHGRDDLSVNAHLMVSRLDAAVVQP